LLTPWNAVTGAVVHEAYRYAADGLAGKITLFWQCVRSLKPRGTAACCLELDFTPGRIAQMSAPTSLITWFLKPLSRFLVGLIAIPLLRAVRRRIPGLKEWDGELEKDIDEWFRGALLLLVATKNAELWLMNHINSFLEASDRINLDSVDLNQWYITAGRLLLAIGVIESMPDQDLFSIIHPGPRWKYDRSKSLRANVRSECGPLCRGIVCQHLNRASPMFAILSVFFGGLNGWIFYALAVVQYLLIGLVTSRDRALNVLSQFDRVVAEKRQEIIDEFSLRSPPPAPIPQPVVADSSSHTAPK
jgi:hypothetical protein